MFFKKIFLVTFVSCSYVNVKHMSGYTSRTIYEQVMINKINLAVLGYS